MIEWCCTQISLYCIAHLFSTLEYLTLVFHTLAQKQGHMIMKLVSGYIILLMLKIMQWPCSGFMLMYIGTSNFCSDRHQFHPFHSLYREHHENIYFHTDSENPVLIPLLISNWLEYQQCYANSYYAYCPLSCLLNFFFFFLKCQGMYLFCLLLSVFLYVENAVYDPDTQ